MKCAILLAKLCLFDPANLALEAQASWQVSGDFTYWNHEGRYTDSIGRATLVVDVPLRPRLKLRYGVEHRSYAEDSYDRGEERAFLGFEWHPFRRRR